MDEQFVTVSGVGFAAEPAALGTAGVSLLLLLLVIWFVIASAAALRGGTMEQAHRLAQMYGYTVCLVAVIVGLISTVSIVGAAFDRAHPLQSEYSFGASLTSFEAYRATAARERGPVDPSQTAVVDTASDATLRRRYEALAADRIASTLFRTSKTFLTSGIMLVVAIALFVIHWRWLRTLGRVRATG